MVNIFVGRLGETRAISVTPATTVKTALNAAGYDVQTNERIEDVTGNRYNGNEFVHEGFCYLLVTNVKSGR